MVKCMQHNEQITKFCLNPTCNSNTAGGCPKCFAQQHLHAQLSQYIIDLDQLNKIMSRYSFPNKVKPECVNLQQSFYSFFKKVQNQMKEIISTIDDICKNVVNTIGFPYVCYNNHFTVYKRIKNKEFNRIPTSQFQKFITQTKNTPIPKLAELEEKLYLKQVNNSHQMIKQIDHMISSFENVIKYYEQKVKFVHDNSEYIKNKEIVEKIRTQLKKDVKNNQIDGRQSLIVMERQKRTISQQETSNNLLRSEPGTGNEHKETLSNKRLDLVKPSALVVPKIQGLQRTITPPANLKTSMTQFIQKQRRRDFMKQQMKDNNRQRRVSLDAHLVKKSKLEQKAAKLRSQKKKKEEQPTGDQDDEDQSQRFSGDKIKNNNLPAQQQRLKPQKNTDEVEVLPIHRKLNQKIFNEEQTVFELQSPLLKNKMKAKSRSNAPQNNQNKVTSNSHGNNSNKTSPQVNKSAKDYDFDIKLQKIKQNLPQLNEKQEKSFMLLIASLRLQASAAIPLLEKALDECTKNLSAAQYLSYLYLQSNQFQKCMKICNKYLFIIGNNKNLNQSRILLQNNKCSALNNLGRYSQTVKILQDQPKNNEGVLKNLANAYYGLGFLDQAITLYKKILDDCTDDEVFYNISSCYYLIKDYKSAKNSISLALTLQPGKKQYVELLNYINIIGKLQ